MKQKDLFLVPFPFSDLGGNKVRPVLIVSNNKFNNSSNDVLVCAITSNDSIRALELNNNHLSESSLHKTCYVKPESILKISKQLLLKKIGQVKSTYLTQVRSKIIELF